jgi:molybdate transport system ATP-binding protein
VTLEIDVRKRLRDFELAVALAVPPGVTLVAGPSGAGKTTLLRLVAGLLRADSGRIALGDVAFAERRRSLAPHRRGVGYVFQEYALFPHLDALENVAFGLRARGVGRAARERRAREVLDRFELGAYARARVGELSGGQRQRVALARALAPGPRVILLDEPLSALDGATRDRVRAALREILRDANVPTLLVTHDDTDRAAFGGRTIRLADGAVVADAARVYQSAPSPTVI